jgi:hypothetical protein
MSRRKINFLKKLVNRSTNSPLPLALLRWKFINICACHTDPAGQRRFSGKAPGLYDDKAAHLSRLLSGRTNGFESAFASAPFPTRSIRPWAKAQHSILPFTRKVVPPNIRFSEA